MLIVNRQSPFVMISWDDFVEILRSLPRKKLIELFKNDYEEDYDLESMTGNQIVELVFRENEGDII